MKPLALIALLLAPQPGTATWYGADFHGLTMANGQRYDMHAMTAANNKLPFGTQVELVNPANGQSVVVEVTDRGAFKHEFDLSWAAFSKLAHPDVGVLKVRWRVLPEVPAREVPSCACIPTGPNA